MQSKVIWINSKDTIETALNLFKKHRIFTLPVVDDGHILVGLVSKTQLLPIINHAIPLSATVDQVMITNVITVWPETTIITVGSLIRNKGIGRFPVVNKRGQLVGIVTKTDILSVIAHEAEKMLMETKIILNSADNGVIAIDLEGKIRILNSAAEKMLDLPQNASVGQYISKLTDKFEINEVLKSGQPQLAQRYNVRGKTFIANTTPVTLNENIVGAVSVLQDTTKLKAIAFELEEVKNLKETLLTLVENPYEAAVVIDDKGIIKLVNKAFTEFFNTSIKEVIGKNVNDVVPDSQLMEVIKTGKPQLADIWKFKGQEFVVMRVPIIKEGKIIGAIGKSLFANMNLAKEFAKRLNQMEGELAYYKSELQKAQTSKYFLENFIGKSEQVKLLKQKIKKAAQTTSTVLILGESGTGKELLAHAIHQLSPRAQGPFVKVNCAGIPEQLLESELFGYHEGAFTGAKKGGQLGKFQAAHTGTIFLDEIGDMPMAMQVKLLRVLQEKEVEPIGSNKQHKIDVRIIAATNRNLEKLIQEDSFRADLYYRLNVVTLQTPPLRERREDIPEICNYLLEKLNKELGTNIKEINQRAMDILNQYTWPGNIRELQNVLERAINLAEQDILTECNFYYLFSNTPNSSNDPLKEEKIIKTLEEKIFEAEKEAIIMALEHTNNNKNQTAKLLGIHRSKLYRKLEQHGIKL
jgi:transcriptional regulator with PAS, ATPase and Fis domain